MPFFEYRQNNSGGGFDFDADAGISLIVIIEADDPDEANGKAESIGIYFDGCHKGYDCPCCGDRWSYAYGSGDPEPLHYGDRIQDVDFEKYPNSKRIKSGPEAYVHFKDGKIQSYGLPRKQL